METEPTTVSQVINYLNTTNYFFFSGYQAAGNWKTDTKVLDSTGAHTLCQSYNPLLWRSFIIGAYEWTGKFKFNAEYV